MDMKQFGLVLDGTWHMAHGTMAEEMCCRGNDHEKISDVQKINPKSNK